MIAKLKQFIVGHKAVSVIAGLIIVLGAYVGYTRAKTTAAVSKYVLQRATMGTVVASISGSGQVTPVTAVDVKPEITENVVRVLVKVGDHVSQGQPLVELDSTNEAKAVQQAEISLQSAKLGLAKLEQPPTASTLASTQNAVTQAKNTLVQASTTLEKDYQGGFDTLTSSFIDFENVMLGLQDFVGGNEVNHNQSNPDAFVNIMPAYLQSGTVPYRNDLESRYGAALAGYGANLPVFHAANRNSDQASLDALFSQTYATSKLVSDAVKSSKDFLNYIVTHYPNASSTNPLPSVTNTFQNNLNAYTDVINNDVASLAALQNSIVSDKAAIQSAALDLQEKQDSLNELNAGPNDIDVQSSELSVQSQQMNLEDAEEKLADATVRAPIDGIVSAIPAIPGEAASGSVASIVGAGDVADITLNEVDAAKVNVGDKATLTFDAIDGLSLAGQVVELDPVGTVSQGVVNYNAKISFADPNAQVKPGMSVSADVATSIASDVIAVPNGAVVTQAGASYVLEPSDSVSGDQIAASAQGGIPLASAPRRVPVTVGLASDAMTQITSGINVGDVIITRTVTSGGTAPAGASASGAGGLRIGGGFFGGGGGGGVRVNTGGGRAGG